MRTSPAIILVLGLVAAPAGQQRDVPMTPPVGTAVVAGTVVTDETPPVPARRALLTITSIAGGDSRTTVSDDRGRFSFDALPAGRFTLTASKGGYVKSMYGATRAGGSGVALAVAEGQRTTGLLVTLVRGGVITGTLRDRRGAPVRNVRVYATRPGTQVDLRHGLTDTDAGASAITDDRGIYRIFGLPPGDYIVLAVPAVDFNDDYFPYRDGTSRVSFRALANTTYYVCVGVARGQVLGAVKLSVNRSGA